MLVLIKYSNILKSASHEYLLNSTLYHYNELDRY